MIKSVYESIRLALDLEIDLNIYRLCKTGNAPEGNFTIKPYKLGFNSNATTTGLTKITMTILSLHQICTGYKTASISSYIDRLGKSIIITSSKQENVSW